MTQRQTLTIERIGIKGDGVAMVDGQAVFIPLAAPGDHFSAAVSNGAVESAELLSSGEARAPAPCSHFGRCGGCVAQHLKPDVYTRWKHDIVCDALAAHGIDVVVEGPRPCAQRARRRATFTLANIGHGEVDIGFMEQGTRTLVPLQSCLVITAEMETLWPLLKQLAQTCYPPGHRGQMTVLDTPQGFDIAIRSAHPVSDDIRRGLVGQVRGTAVARLTINRESLYVQRDPVLQFGDVAVSLPAGGFAQAVTSAEHMMAELVIEHVGQSKTVLDLFAGSGTFTLRLARRNEVVAMESDGAALGALERAWKTHSVEQKLRRVSVQKRDLYMNPVPTRDLGDFRAVVLDPPRAGAEQQCRYLAKSSVQRIASVSCNAETFARDTAILIDGGYRLERVVAIDQFLWSAHVEVVGLFSKPAGKPKRGLG